MFLTAEEVEELTGKSRATAQRSVLDAMGFRYLQRPDGSLVLLRRYVEEAMGARQDLAPPEPQVRF